MNIKHTLYILFFISSCVVSGQLIDPYRYAPPVSTLYNLGDAADPNNETNTVSGSWTTDADGTTASVTTSPYDGSYSVEIERTNTGTLELGFPLTVADATSTSVSVRCYEVSGDWQILLRDFNGWSTTQFTSIGGTGTWVEMIFTATTAATTASITFKDQNSTVGNKLRVDYVIVTQ